MRSRIGEFGLDVIDNRHLGRHLVDQLGLHRKEAAAPSRPVVV
jgi:hypothetical protein